MDAVTAVRPLDPERPLRELLGRGSGTLLEVLEARAGRPADADRTFLAWHPPGGTPAAWSYAESFELARRTAAGLRACGVQPGDRVASFLSNGPDAIWAWLGTMCAGGVYVGLNREFRGTLLRELVARAGHALLVTEPSALDVLAPLELDPAGLVLVDDGSGPLTGSLRHFAELRAADPLDPHPSQPGELATIVFTSGSTGRSKAVLLPHNYLVRCSAAMTDGYGLEPSDVFHGWLPHFHLAAQLDVYAAAAVAGCAVAMFPTFSASRFWDQVRASGATIVVGFPMIANVLLGRPEIPADRDHSLRRFVVPGADPAMYGRIRERFGAQVLNVYGLSEADNLTLQRHDVPSPDGSAGAVNPDYEVVVLDEQDAVVPPGTIGEIAVRPRLPHIMFSGYEGDPEATVHAWRNLWFHTSDLGYFDEDGHLFFVARTRDRIRRRGKNIAAGEVEALLLEHPQVRECAVVPVPSELGEDEVKAAVLTSDAASFDLAGFRAWCLQAMPPYMAPRFLELYDDDLPRMAVGKVDKTALRRPCDRTLDLAAGPGA